MKRLFLVMVVLAMLSACVVAHANTYSFDGAYPVYVQRGDVTGGIATFEFDNALNVGGSALVKVQSDSITLGSLLSA